MAIAEKFNFDISFDAPHQAEVEPSAAQSEEEPPPEPVYTLSELQAIEHEAFDKGFAQGAEEARADSQREFDTSVERALLEVMEGISKQLTTMSATISEVQQRQGDDALRLAVSVSRKVMPKVLHDQALETIDALIAELLPAVLDEPRIVVRVNDAILDEVSARLEPHRAATGFPGEFIVLADPSLAKVDCRLEWADGGIAISPDRVWDEINRIVDDHFAVQAALGSAENASAKAASEQERAPNSPRFEAGAASEEITVDG